MPSLYKFSAISSSRDEEMEAELMQEANAGDQEFLYGIAKISQGLRKFRNDSENFAILAKFRYGHIFSMIAKIRYHSENFLS